MAAPKKPKIHMQEQPADVRIQNFEEVPLGYTDVEAKEEASRCLMCKNPKCEAGCPVNIQIRDFIKLIADGDFQASVDKIKETNALPAICGRVCPQEEQCEEVCIMQKMGNPINIGGLERFVADKEASLKKEVKVLDIKPMLDSDGNQIKVAIAGSGPAGLTVAGDLAKMGYKATIFEALHEAGGVLVYGIPEFRLPKQIVKDEIEGLKKLGVELERNVLIGKTYTLDDLKEMGFKAIFIGVGAGTPTFMGIPGENLKGIFSANEVLTRLNLLKAYKFPEYDTPIKIAEKVAVIGAGNVAMDAARTYKRLPGVKEVHIIYRRSEAEMPARKEEIERAKEEGIIFNLLTNPVEVIGDEKGWVSGLKCIKMELGEPDDSGRRRPVEIKGSEFVIDIGIAIPAIGTKANKLLTSEQKGLDINKWGYIQTDEATGATSLDGVFAGGDISTGAATVIAAMGAGRASAKAMHEYIQKSIKN